MWSVPKQLHDMSLQTEKETYFEIDLNTLWESTSVEIRWEKEAIIDNQANRERKEIYAMKHVVLLGDSIFDNAAYVPDKPAVIDQLRNNLAPDWKATLLAVDGHVTEDVISQTSKLPKDASHLVVSCGGKKRDRYFMNDIDRFLCNIWLKFMHKGANHAENSANDN